MKTKLYLEIEVEDIDIANLKGWVASEDEIDSGEGNGIAAENVTAVDVLMQLQVSAIEYTVTRNEMKEVK
jgi:hypothetical protein